MDQEPLIYIEVPYETANYPHFVVHKHFVWFWAGGISRFLVDRQSGGPSSSLQLLLLLFVSPARKLVKAHLSPKNLRGGLLQLPCNEGVLYVVAGATKGPGENFGVPKADLYGVPEEGMHGIRAHLWVVTSIVDGILSDCLVKSST